MFGELHRIGSQCGELPHLWNCTRQRVIDGCNTIICLCGKQFSWSAEKENTDRCLQFLQSYPVDTSTAVCQQAHAWQLRNRQEVSQALQKWFMKKFDPCPSQSCVMLKLEAQPEGVKQAVEIWKAHRYVGEKYLRNKNQHHLFAFVSLVLLFVCS